MSLARSTVRRILVTAGLVSSRQRRPPSDRERRRRMPQEGLLVQIDGSPHAWLEDRGPWLTLLLAVDGATSTVPYALFSQEEVSYGYFLLIQGLIRRRGIPVALYSNRHGVFRTPARGRRTSEEQCPSHLGGLPIPSQLLLQAFLQFGVDLKYSVTVTVEGQGYPRLLTISFKSIR